MTFFPVEQDWNSPHPGHVTWGDLGSEDWIAGLGSWCYGSNHPHAIPMCCCQVLMLWSTLSAGYWTNPQEKPGMSVPCDITPLLRKLCTKMFLQF